MSEIRIDASSLVDEIRVDASSVDELDIVVDGITTLDVNTADSTIDGLKDETSGGEIPDEDYNWFKSLYASLVDGSVKSWVKGLVSQLRLLAARVLALEYEETLVYTVPGNASSVTIMQFPDGRPLGIQEGETVEIITRIMGFVGGINDRLALRVNGISDRLYRFAGAGLYRGVMLAGAANLVGIYQPRFTLINGELVGTTNAYTNTSGVWGVTPQFYPFITEGISVPSINSITLYSESATASIPAGEKIIIKIHRKNK